MSCNCANGNTSQITSGLFGRVPSNKIIKISGCASGTAITVLEGARMKSKLELCDWNTTYAQYFHNSIILEPGATNREIQYGGLGSQITFIAIKVTYTPTTNVSVTNITEIPVLSYIMESEPTVVRYMDDLMILSGTTNHRIPKIFLSNPTTKFSATVEMIASTESVTFDDVIVSQIGDEVITVENLTFRNITSDSNNININSTSGTHVAIRWIDVTNIELNNKIITITDYVQGTINLSFLTDYNSYQAYSLIKWAMNGNNITGYEYTDDTPPTINYSTSFSTEIVLLDFSTSGIILKDDIFYYLVNSITDNRDGTIGLSPDILTIREVGSNLNIDAIDELGHYHFIFDVYDNAGNLQTDAFIFNIKDTDPPRLVLSEFGLNLFDAYSTSGLYLESNSYIILSDPTQQSIYFNGNTGESSFIILDNNLIEISYTSTDFIFDTLSFDLNTINVSQVYTAYNIRWDGNKTFTIIKI